MEENSYVIASLGGQIRIIAYPIKVLYTGFLTKLLKFENSVMIFFRPYGYPFFLKRFRCYHDIELKFKKGLS